MKDKVQLIKEEIERRIKEGSSKNDISEGALALDSLLDFIDSFPEEHNEDLDFQTFAREMHTVFALPSSETQNTEENPLNWEYAIARHFAEWQKQQMMKDAVLETKVIIDCDGDGIETPYEEWLTLEDTEISYIPDNLGLKEGDKVKIIILKTE